MRIFFLKRALAKPSGGHRHIRLLAARLNEIGQPARLLFLAGDPAKDWTFGIPVPRAPFAPEDAGRRIRAEDVVIMPENQVGLYLEAVAGWRCRKAVLCQNGYYALRSRPPGGYARHGIEFVLVTTPLLAAITHAALGMRRPGIGLVPCLVDRAPPRAEEPAPPRIPDSVCFMPRKLPGHLREIRARLARTSPGITWVPIDGVAEREVTAIFQRCGVFLSTQDEEGFGSPAIEAMSCGCVVAGYAGTGGFRSPYASEQNGLWVPDRSIPPAVAAVRRALAIVRREGPELGRLRAQGRETAAAFSRQAFDQAVRRLVAAAARRPFKSGPFAWPVLDAGSWRQILGILSHRRPSAVSRTTKPTGRSR